MPVFDALTPNSGPHTESYLGQYVPDSQGRYVLNKRMHPHMSASMTSCFDDETCLEGP